MSILTRNECFNCNVMVFFCTDVDSIEAIEWRISEYTSVSVSEERSCGDQMANGLGETCGNSADQMWGVTTGQ